MTITEYEKFIKKFRAKGDKQANEKRVEYTESRGDQDVLANFKATSEDIEIDPLKVLYTFMKKHWSSIVNFIKTGKVFSAESIYSRIQDLIQYLELTAACIYEKEMKNMTEKSEAATTDFPQETAPVGPIINKDTVRKTLLDQKRGIQNDQEC